MYPEMQSRALKLPHSVVRHAVHGRYISVVTGAALASYNSMHRVITGGFEITNISYFSGLEVRADGHELEFQDPKQQAKFELGVRMALDQWEELKLAEEHYRGDADLSAKRESIARLVIGDFRESPLMDITNIDETLANAVEAEFDTCIENDSPYLIGELILKMYRECRVHDYSRIDDMHSRFQEKQLAGQFKRSVAIGQDQDPNSHVKDEDGPDPALKDMGWSSGTCSSLAIVEYDSD